jgi:DNA replication protein DnaC
VVFLGPPGGGKTHLAISLAIAAAQIETSHLENRRESL